MHLRQSVNHFIRFSVALFVAILAADALANETGKAQAFFKAGLYLEARHAFEEIYRIDPKNAEAAYYIGRLHVMHDDPLAGIPYLEKAVELSPDNSDYFYWLGNSYGSAALKVSFFEKPGYAKKCHVAYEKAIQLAPENIDAHMSLLTFYRQAPSFTGGGMDKAHAEAQEILKLDPLRGNLAIADMNISEKKYDEAFAVYAKILGEKPDFYAAHYYLARLAVQTGTHLDQAKACLQRCLELKPEDSDASHALAQWRLGNIAEKENDIPGARAAYEAALKLDPDLKQAKDSLAKLR